MPTKGNQDGSSNVSRRRFIQAAGAVGVTAGLAGCGGGNDGTTTTGDTGGGGGTTAGEPGGDDLGGTVNVFAGKVWKENEETFTQTLHDAGVPDAVNINLNSAAQQTGSKQQRLRTTIDAESKDPDLVLTDNGWTIPFIVRGDLVNLEKEMDSDFISKVKEEGVQSMVQTGSDPETGDLHSVPVFPDFPTITYRKDLFKEVGYTESDFQEWQSNPLGWKKFTSIVAEAKQAGDAEYGYVWQGKNYGGLSCCTFNEYLTSMGGSFFGGEDNLFGPVGDRPVTIGDEKAIDGIELARDLISGNGESPIDVTGVSPEEVAGWIEPDTKSIFEAQNAVAQRNWTYSIGGAVNNFEGTDAELGVMPIPKGPNGSWHAQGGWVLSMNPYSDNKSAAKEVIKAWWSDDMHKAQLDAANYMPPKPRMYDYVKQHPTYGPYFKPLQYAAEHLIPRPTTSVWPTQSTVIAKQVNAAITKKKSPADAAEAMATKIKAIENQAQ
ncbi:substrate-binding domain-containing protein [Halorhabdus rudnickae]|uniref:substrate-binding domain-containing protein n=1 Tax=Halorhabdus rudnickae TaxID=1775544 RepID=UPI0010844AE8|nr:substrate-binding domain-containing protein [Halorhabdus rudnickae]